MLVGGWVETLLPWAVVASAGCSEATDGTQSQEERGRGQRKVRHCRMYLSRATPCYIPDPQTSACHVCLGLCRGMVSSVSSHTKSFQSMDQAIPCPFVLTEDISGFFSNMISEGTFCCHGGGLSPLSPYPCMSLSCGTLHFNSCQLVSGSFFEFLARRNLLTKSY